MYPVLTAPGSSVLPSGSWPETCCVDTAPSQSGPWLFYNPEVPRHRGSSQTPQVQSRGVGFQVDKRIGLCPLTVVSSVGVGRSITIIPSLRFSTGAKGAGAGPFLRGSGGTASPLVLPVGHFTRSLSNQRQSPPPAPPLWLRPSPRPPPHLHPHPQPRPLPFLTWN